MPKRKRKLEYVVAFVVGVIVATTVPLSTNQVKNQVTCSHLSFHVDENFNSGSLINQNQTEQPLVALQEDLSNLQIQSSTTRNQETQTQASTYLAAQTVKYEIQNVTLDTDQEFALTTVLQSLAPEPLAALNSQVPVDQTPVVDVESHEQDATVSSNSSSPSSFSYSPPSDKSVEENTSKASLDSSTDLMKPTTMASSISSETIPSTTPISTVLLANVSSYLFTNTTNTKDEPPTTQSSIHEQQPQSPSLLIDKDQSTWNALPTIKPNVSRWVLAWNQLTNGENEFYGGYPIYKVTTNTTSANQTVVEISSSEPMSLSKNESISISTVTPGTLVKSTLVDKHIKTAATTRKPTNSNSSKRIAQKGNKPEVSEFVNMLHTVTTTTTTQRPYVAKRDCGVRPMKREGRVVGGRDSHLGEFPWSVLIRETSLMGLFVKTKCGGVLIDLKWVLTAAHCQPGMFGSLVVVVGEYDLIGNTDKLKPIVRKVKRMIVHRDYNPSNFDNDIALLELESPYQIQPHVVPICLPDKEEEFIGQPAMVAGWGKLSFGGPVPSVLQVAKLPVIGNKQCQEMYHQSGHMKIISDSFLCAGYETGGQDSCEGDSGGPLQTQRLVDGRWVLVGTVSHGIKCAEPNLPGIYIRTTAYLPWIKAVMYHQDTNKRYGHRRQILFS